MDNKLSVSISPHIHSPLTTRRIMLDVIIALVPTAVAGTVIFGLRSLAVLAVCISVCVLSEYIFNLICKRDCTISDLSAVVTGLLLALNLPSTIPLWQAAVGGVFAIVVVKCLFGGIGQNFANPAITARIFMLISFSAGTSKAAFPVITDTVATATPLSVIPAGGELPTIKDMLFGLRGGAIGETCIIAILIGFIYLLARGVITFHTPVTFVATVFALTYLFTGELMQTVYYTLSGGLFLGAVFMATDYATTPSRGWGKVIFGFGCGLLTVAIRLWGVYPEGVSFAILFMNIITPYIERWTAKKPFGTEVKA